jgi:hypothetical protein
MNERDLLRAAGNPADAPLPIVILAGQSNAQGWMGDGRMLEKDPVDANILFRWMICGHSPMLPGESQKSRGWGTLEPQNGICGHGNPASHFGPEISMARKLVKAGRPVTVLKVTIGASSLHGDWRLPGQKGLTDDLLAETKAALADLNQAGRKARIRGFIWIQGESDADSDEHVRGFKELLTRLIAGLREEWDEPGLPVILGLDEQHPGPAARPMVVEAQKAIATADKGVAFTTMVGLEKADVSHLTNTGLEQHGERLAEALTKLWERESNQGFE